MKSRSLSSSSRRCFLKSSLYLAGAAAVATRSFAAEAAAGPALRAAVIGHTGRGNYGHEMDLIFNDIPNIEVVAVADPDAAGRAKAAARCKAQREYADYREMLGKEKPNLVCVAPRWTDQHHAMMLAALKVGAHVYVEKPFTQTLAEADELLSTAGTAGLKIAVAHQMRLAPSIQFLTKALEKGELGQLLEIRAHGKQDSRAGGEDMVVLGTHLFDLMRLLAGDALWCTARILSAGGEAALKDARTPSENIGPVLGDEIDAQFGFANGVHGRFTSRGRFRQTAGHWGLELIGTKATVKVLADVYPNVFISKPGEWSPEGRTDTWRRMEGDPSLALPAAERAFVAANRRVVDDWLRSIRAKDDPACSGRAGMKSLEMIMAVFQAGLTRERVAIPMTRRDHPLRASSTAA